MEENFYDTDFEDYLKEKADQYKMYPSDRVWKGIERSMRSSRKWYWTGFVLLLTGVSYFAINELLAPAGATRHQIQAPAPQPQAGAEQLDPFFTAVDPLPVSETASSEILVEDSGVLTASLDIPLRLFDIADIKGKMPEKISLLITGLPPLNQREEYNIELTWPENSASPASSVEDENGSIAPAERINWLHEQAGVAVVRPQRIKKLSWQLAFSPTVNYRKLSSERNEKLNFDPLQAPYADVNRAVSHRPALGFELGTHGVLQLNKRLALRGGLQFNYSKYDIAAARTPTLQSAVIALDASTGNAQRTLTSYTNINNYTGTRAESLKNQYFQLSVPVGLEFRVFGSDRLSFNVAGSMQPTYLLNKNTYLITTDYKNYTKEPSLVRRWNVNTGAEAFVSYTRGDVKWQIGPQFRYQLLSSYENVYPIKEYLMEYGIKVGITRTIR